MTDNKLITRAAAGLLALAAFTIVGAACKANAQEPLPPGLTEDAPQTAEERYEELVAKRVNMTVFLVWYDGEVEAGNGLSKSTHAVAVAFEHYLEGFQDGMDNMAIMWEQRDAAAKVAAD
jgi:hypothetical protein